MPMPTVQDQPPDTVIQFGTIIQIDNAVGDLKNKQIQLNFDDFDLVSDGQQLSLMSTYSGMSSHGDFSISSGQKYEWDARYVVKQGITSFQLGYNGTANVHINYVDKDFSSSGLQRIPSS